MGSPRSPLPGAALRVRFLPEPVILPRMPRRALGPLAFVVAVAVVGWLISGVAALDIVKFVAYDGAFVAIPGAALLWAVRGRPAHLLVTIALGWPLGQALEILAFSATAAVGLRGLFLLYPIVVIVPSALLIYRRRAGVEQDPDSEGLSVGLMWTVATALSVGLVYLTIMFLPTASLPTSTVLLEYPDFPYFLGLIAQVTHHWPPTNAGLYGVPLAYEWFVFFHTAAANQVTHVSIPIIALRLDYVPTILVVGCQLLTVGRFVGRAAWTGALAVIVVFLMGPLDLVANPSGSAFGDGVFINLWDSWTFPFGLLFFLGLLYLITERFRADTWRTPDDVRSWALIALLMIGASGAKATVLPVIIVGTGMYVVLHFVVRRTLPVAGVVTVGLGIVIFIATYLVIYAGNTPDTVIAFLKWLGGTPPVLFAESIHHTIVRAIVLPLAYAAGLAGLLFPLFGMLYLLRRRHRREIPSLTLSFCMLVAGALIASVVHQSSYSEGYFEETGYIAAAIVAAAGLRFAWLDVGRGLPISRRGVVATVAGCIVVFLLVAKLRSGSIPTPRSDLVLYAAIAAAVVIILLGWALVLRAGKRSTSGILALGLIPMVAASVLTTPFVVYPNVRKFLAGEPITATQPVLVPGLLTALYWLRDHAPIDAVFAVNNHWVDPGRLNGKYYYYAAFSERQIFIEAYDPIRYGITPGIPSRAATIFAYRQGVNDAVFNSADADALHIMTQQYAVRFLFIDRIHGTFDPAVLKLGDVVFTNQDATIIAVG